MKVIRTVRGDIAPAELGLTQPHEHLWDDQRLCRFGIDFPGNHTPMVLRDLEAVIADVADYYTAGGRAIAEMTPLGLGRDVRVLKEISERTGIHVIACSGFYVQECHPDFVADASIDELVEFLVGELTVGADGTEICAGLLKSAIGRPRVEGVDAKCARAVARAQVHTGVAITTHTSASVRFEIEGGNAGTMLLDIFEAEGVDPRRVIIGHTDENVDLRQLVAFARRGAYVQFDVIGTTSWILDDTRVDLLRRLVDLGFENQLLLSSDCCGTKRLKANGGPGYEQLLRTFVPRLRQAGFDDAPLHRIMVQNPASILAFETAKPLPGPAGRP